MDLPQKPLNISTICKTFYCSPCLNFCIVWKRNNLIFNIDYKLYIYISILTNVIYITILVKCVYWYFVVVILYAIIPKTLCILIIFLWKNVRKNVRKRKKKIKIGCNKMTTFLLNRVKKTSDYYNPSVLSILNKGLRSIDSEDIGGTNERSLQRKWLHREYLWISYGSRKL